MSCPRLSGLVPGKRYFVWWWGSEAGCMCSPRRLGVFPYMPWRLEGVSVPVVVFVCFRSEGGSWGWGEIGRNWS